MRATAAITVGHPREEVEARWRERPPVPDAQVRFADAPGDRGTEIHIALEQRGGLGRLLGSDARAKAKDELRHFKQRLETGEVPRSDSTPEGESIERKFKQRPAQPLSEAERAEVGV